MHYVLYFVFIMVFKAMVVRSPQFKAAKTIFDFDCRVVPPLFILFMTNSK